MAKKIVSILIPAYNRANLTEETINSALAQTYHDFVCSQYINWQVVFNTNRIGLSELKTTVTLAVFINGIEKLNVQFITSLVGMIVNIPLAILLLKVYLYNLGGIVLSSIISLSFFLVFETIHIKKILYKREI